MSRRREQGIETRHARSCRSRDGEACNCKPTYQANVWLNKEEKRVRKTFPTLAAARAWRHDAVGAARRGQMKAPSRKTLREAAETWLTGAKSGQIRNRSGAIYKPSTLREYETDLNTHVLPEIGHMRLTNIDRRDAQAVVEKMLGDGWEASTIRNAINPLRAICKRAIRDGEISVNPTADLELPIASNRRERVAPPAEAAKLLAALPESIRPIYATAFYAGLRRGELQALRWDDVDLANGVIYVRRSWDAREGAIETKSEKGKRTAPIPAVLRDVLVDHGLRTNRAGSDFVFGRTATAPFTPTYVRDLAIASWEAENACQDAEALPESQRLTSIGLHECRHTYVTLMFEAGNTLERIGDFVGHSDSYMTSRYRHLLPGTGADAAAKLDAYLAEQIQTV